jgi:hypothetical protein
MAATSFIQVNAADVCADLLILLHHQKLRIVSMVRVVFFGVESKIVLLSLRVREEKTLRTTSK